MEWLTYLLKVTACTVLFFGFYLVVLRKLTFFKINRFYLLATLLLSFIIPALHFEIKREITTVETEAPVNIPEIKPADEAPVQLIQPIMLKYQPEVRTQVDWMLLMYTVYGATAALLLLVCLWRLFGLLKHTGSYTQNYDGLKLISKTQGFTNCSFFNYVFINDEDLSAADLSVLLKHEQVHARQYHSIDKLVLMVFKAVLWFNPVVYLYDKALEQVHEYEADEVTSTGYGSRAYANLLLKLAITKSEMPLIHNFVKSPIKDRIKMLFNQKSTNMKKLVYVLALPILLGLVYSFTVAYVDVAPTVQTEIKTLQTDSLLGKPIEGVVIEFGKKRNHKTFGLKTATGTYSIEYNNVNNKLKIGDKIVVLISASILPPAPIGEPNRFKDVDITYVPQTIKDLKGNLIYEYKPEKYAFLYEANKARFATSKIKSIKKGANNKLEKIVLNDGLFTINLNLTAQNIKDDNFKRGDKVLVKFIGEKLVSKNTYTTDKLIILYSEPKKYIIKNEALYDRFYHQDGKQKIAVLKSNDYAALVPKIISFRTLRGDVKGNISYFSFADLIIGNSKLIAEELIWDKEKGLITAKKARLDDKMGDGFISAQIVLDLNKSKSKDFSSSGNAKYLITYIEDGPAKGSLLGTIKYGAIDSVKTSKDQKLINLYGRARVYNDDLMLEADKIIFNKQNGDAKAINGSLLTKSRAGVKRFDSLHVKFDIQDKKN